LAQIMALSDSSRGSQTPSEPKINANFEFLDSLLEILKHIICDNLKK
jgi:hypothetical protein